MLQTKANSELAAQQALLVPAQPRMQTSWQALNTCTADECLDLIMSSFAHDKRCS